MTLPLPLARVFVPLTAIPQGWWLTFELQTADHIDSSNTRSSGQNDYKNLIRKVLIWVFKQISVVSQIRSLPSTRRILTVGSSATGQTNQKDTNYTSLQELEAVFIMSFNEHLFTSCVILYDVSMKEEFQTLFHITHPAEHLQFCSMVWDKHCRDTMIVSVQKNKSPELESWSARKKIN